MRILIAAALLCAFALTPASAAMMASTSDNMTKSTMMMAPGQTGAVTNLTTVPDAWTAAYGAAAGLPVVPVSDAEGSVLPEPGPKSSG